MIVRDRLYGRFEINEAVIIELIRSQPLQRLKGISQFGIPDEYYIEENFYRYEHSVGVMLLLRKLGASLEEQIAGLLHDVSHTAFSHTIDWVVGEGGAEEYQDMQHNDFIMNSVIPEILKKHGFSTEEMVDYKHFKLLERDIPDLCADRIDYSLREFPADVAATCLTDLTVANNQIVFASKKSAELFATHFLKQQNEHWGSAEAVVRFRLFADVLRMGLQDKTIVMEDFWQDDAHVLEKIEASKNPNIQKILNFIKKGPVSQQAKSKRKVFKKFRHVDPLYLEKDKLKRLSESSTSFAAILEKSRRANKAGIRVPVV